jgi:hypothetical protein
MKVLPDMVACATIGVTGALIWVKPQAFYSVCSGRIRKGIAFPRPLAITVRPDHFSQNHRGQRPTRAGE